MNRVALVALLVACGGKTVARDRSPPALLARACACTDDACRAAADRELALAYQQLPEDELRGAVAEQARVTECLGATDEAALGALAERAMQQFAARACSCEDAACLDAVDDSYEPLDRDLRALVERTAFRRSVRAEAERLQACIERIRPTISADQALAGAAALRDRACACADAACATKVQGEVETFLVANRDVTGTEAQTDQIAAIFRELGECLAKVSEAAPP